MGLVLHENARVSARGAARVAALERRLERYQPPYRSRVRALAARHPHLRDLARSFPALLFALAVPRPGVDVARAIACVIAGAPLKTAAEAAGVPMWLRRIAPGAFGAPIPALPDGLFVRRQVVNHIPRATKKVQGWLDAISRAHLVADDDIAVWMAREWASAQARNRSYYVPWPMLWSWYARHAPEDPCRLREPWRSSLSYESVERLACEWRHNVLFFVELGDEAIADLWLEPGNVGGFDFVPLRIYADIASEATAMRNCVRTYGCYIRENMSRLWSMQRGGERVATVEVQFAQESPYPHVAEIKLIGDKRAPEGVWRVAQAWLSAQPRFRAGVRYDRWRAAPANVAAWRKMWRPYWLAKRQFPDWAPLTPDREAVDRL